MIEYFRNGAKCGNTPRQADVTFTVGPTMQLISAAETSMCVYKFVIQLPESKCGLPMTDLGDLDTNNEHDCKKWCYSKKHKDKNWHKDPRAPDDPFKCGWFQCSLCSECQ